MYEKVRIPNSVPSRHLLPYLEHMDQTKTYSNFGNLNFKLVERLRTDIFKSRFHITTHSSGTQALIASVLATAGYAKPGKTLCLMSSYTFVATAAVAKNCGYEPFLVDMSADDLMMDPKNAHREIPWDQVGLIMPTCAYGIIGRTQELVKIADKRNIPIVIDGAASFDTLSPELDLGKNAVFCLSMHATKSFNSGEGGLAVCKRPDLSRKIRAVSNFGMDGSRISKYHGTNSKMSEYHAAVGLANLDVWDHHRKTLSAVRKNYLEAFANRGRGPEALKYNTDCSLGYFLLDVSRPEFLMSRFKKSGIDFRFWYGNGLHTTPLYGNCPRTSMTQTNALAGSVLGLPMHIYLSRSDIALIADLVCLRQSSAHAVM